jgi:L-fuculose-phosphate aldolase
MMHHKGFICATDGNVSVKLSDKAFLITRSGINKGFMDEDDILTIDDKGDIIDGRSGYKVSTEWKMHLKAYQLRDDINAVIHAHPPYAVAYTIAEKAIPSDILPETVLTMGSIPVTEYSQPCSPKNADIIQDHIKKYDAIVLKRHGVLTIGEDIFSAYNKLEKLEHTAFTGICSTILGGCNSLPDSELKVLFDTGRKMGFFR